MAERERTKAGLAAELVAMCMYYGAPQREAEQATHGDVLDLWIPFIEDCQKLWAQDAKATVKRMYVDKKAHKRSSALLSVQCRYTTTPRPVARKLFMRVQNSGDCGTEAAEGGTQEEGG